MLIQSTVQAVSTMLMRSLGEGGHSRDHNRYIREMPLHVSSVLRLYPTPKSPKGLLDFIREGWGEEASLALNVLLQTKTINESPYTKCLHI